MSFGLCMLQVLSNDVWLAFFLPDFLEHYMEVFMSDFTNFETSFDECLDNIGAVLYRNIEKNLVLNFEKCHFMIE